jgi:nucleoside-diphosphate-sugar epimerase
MLRHIPLLSRVFSDVGALAATTFKPTILSVPSLDLRPLRTATFKSSAVTVSRKLSQTASTQSAAQQKPNTRHAPMSRISYTSENKTKTVVIIGGRSQLGEALTRRFLASGGWNVVCTSQGKSNHKLDDSGFHLVGDINLGDEKAATKEYWEELFSKIESEQGHIHTVVNCAGISINDPNKGYKMDDVNRKPVAPMLEACIVLGIDRYTFISTQATKYPETRKPASYSKSKYDAEQDIARVMASKTGIKTQATILCPDLIISADNPGHFGSPQRMSTLPYIKLTIGQDPRKAGSTVLQPVVAYDVADAVVNISDYNIPTPMAIDACGPETRTIEDLMSFFKTKQLKTFLIGIKIPSAAVAASATIRPWGAFEPDHLDLIAHHEKHAVEKVDTTEFERIVGLSRSDKKNPLLTLEEAFDFTKRPVYGTHDLGLYTKSLLKQLKAQDVLSLCKGIGIGLAQSRIDFQPTKKTAQRGPNDGINASVLLVGAVGIGLTASFYSQSKDKDKPSNTETAVEHEVTEKRVRVI